MAFAGSVLAEGVKDIFEGGGLVAGEEKNGRGLR